MKENNISVPREILHDVMQLLCDAHVNAVVLRDYANRSSTPKKDRKPLHQQYNTEMFKLDDMKSKLQELMS